MWSSIFQVPLATFLLSTINSFPYKHASIQPKKEKTKELKYNLSSTSSIMSIFVLLFRLLHVTWLFVRNVKLATVVSVRQRPQCW